MVDPELLLELNEAIRSKHSIEMEYYSASSGQTNTRTVDPYYLNNIHGDWYLIAYCHTRLAPRDFLTSRIKAHKRLLSTFQVNPNFSLNAYLETAFSLNGQQNPRILSSNLTNIRRVGSENVNGTPANRLRSYLPVN